MTPEQIIAYLKTLPLTHALWWYIENWPQGSYSEVFYHLRERFRNEQQSDEGVASVNEEAREKADAHEARLRENGR